MAATHPVTVWGWQQHPCDATYEGGSDTPGNATNEGGKNTPRAFMGNGVGWQQHILRHAAGRGERP